MGLRYEKGAEVRVINTVLTGVVEGARLEADMTVLFLVRYIDTDGAEQKRHFREDQLQPA